MNSVTIGMDLGDKKNQVCVLSGAGEVLKEVDISNTVQGLRTFFKGYEGVTVAMETGTHSPWVSRELAVLGCRVLVGNARKLRLIWKSPNKSDVRDARMLARIARFDPELLSPICHRSEQAQLDLEYVKGRDALLQSRTALINHVRGVVKSLGARVPKCSAAAFVKRVRGFLDARIVLVIDLMLESITQLTGAIRGYDRTIEALSQELYPETKVLRQVPGVGPITALAFVLTLEEPARFKKSRTVGAFLGLTPRRDQSGESDKQLRISKHGNSYLRQLLVNCSHYILGPFGPDCDLKKYGDRIAQRGGKKGKRQSVVAVARKLSVLLHRLWNTSEVYQPWYQKILAEK